MKTITDGMQVVSMRAARHVEAWGQVLLLAVCLGLPACSLARDGRGMPIHEWRTFATLRDGAGTTYTVDNWDPVFNEAGAHTFATADSGTPGAAEEVIRGEWRRYLRRRLEAEPHSAAFVMRFGSGPWCLASHTVTRTENTLSEAPDGELGEPLLECPDPGGPTCGNPPGTVPMLQVDPPTAAFGLIPVGTAAPVVTLTLSNAAAGRLCLDGDFSITPTGATLPGEFTGDFVGCRPTSVDELMAGRVILSAADRPSCTVRVVFRPSTGGPRSGRLRVSSNDPASPFDTPLTGEGDPGVLSAPGAVCLNVASEVVGGRTCYRQGFLIRNPGPGSVTITSATVPGADAATWTRAYPDVSAFPLLLAPGADQYIVVLACEPGIRDSVLTVMSNAATPMIDIPLRRPASGCTP
jgi:hypothetical protein